MYGGDFCLWSRWNDGLGFPACLKQLKMEKNNRNIWNNISRHWTTGSRGRWSLRNGGEMSLRLFSLICWERFQATVCGGETKAEPAAPPHLRRQSGASTGNKEAGIDRTWLLKRGHTPRKQSPEICRGSDHFSIQQYWSAVCERKLPKAGGNQPQGLRGIFPSKQCLFPDCQTGKPPKS